MHKHTKEVWKTLIIVIGCLIGLILILGVAVNKNNGSPETYFVRDIAISGTGQTETIQSNEPVYLIVEGEENIVTIDRSTEIIDLTLRGTNNKVILCKDIHNPTIQKSGYGLEIVYRSC